MTALKLVPPGKRRPERDRRERCRDKTEEEKLGSKDKQCIEAQAPEILSVVR